MRVSGDYAWLAFWLRLWPSCVFASLRCVFTSLSKVSSQNRNYCPGASAAPPTVGPPVDFDDILNDR